VEAAPVLERDDFSSSHHLALSYCFEHDLFQEPVSTSWDHALVQLLEFKIAKPTNPQESPAIGHNSTGGLAKLGWRRWKGGALQPT
jgi:hypothetical protein